MKQSQGATTGFTTVQPSGMWLTSYLTESSAGQVNVPEAATLDSQNIVAKLPLVYYQSEKLTFTDESEVQPLNMLS